MSCSGGQCIGTSPSNSVLQHHNHASRDGLYTEPAFTKTAAAGMHADPNFSATVQGKVYAQPLYLSGNSAGPDLLFVVTEEDRVYALNAANGAVVAQRTLGAAVPLSQMPCGNIDPLGITGTPIIDAGSRTLFLDAMTTPDGGATKKHMVFGLSVDDLSDRPGWPVDVSAVVPGFDSSIQGERGALALLNGTLYVPYGGLYGDCGNYHGWVVGYPLSNPSAATAWHTRATAGGVWAPNGIASDGASLYVATGNTFGASTWGDGEAVIRLGPGPSFSQQPADYFAPTTWQQMDSGDADLGGSGPVLFDVPGSSPSALAIALGKNGWGYLLNRNNLGGIGNGVFAASVSGNSIISAAAAYTTAQGTYVAFHASCSSGDLMALKISGSPPSFSAAWCASQNGGGNPIVTTTDGSSNAIVWSIGGGRLLGFDGESGAVVFGGGGSAEAMGNVQYWQTPIVSGGRIFVAGNGTLYAFKP